MRGRVRKGVLVAVGLAAASAALAVWRPSFIVESDATALAVADTAPLVQVHADTIRAGEAIAAVLQRHGLTNEESARALARLTRLDTRRIRAGAEVTATVHPQDGIQRISFVASVDHTVHLERREGDWVEREERLTWSTDTVAVAGVVATTLTNAIIASGEAFPERARPELAYALADVLEYRVDLSRDLRVGDSVTVLVERQQTERGHVRAGRVLATRTRIGGSLIEAVRYDDVEGRPQFYDAEGKSMRAAFLRAPLEFRRISSVFGGRRHPILKTWRSHNGVDYAAARGTPVRSIGDGRVIFAGWRGGYGRTVEIRHNNGMVTRYAHLNGIASGIRSGKSVRIASTIGTVGMTGLATGPHLHFETLIGGTHRDPRTALRNVGGEPLPSKHRDAFALRRRALLSDLDARVLAMHTGRDARDAFADPQSRLFPGRPLDSRGAGASQ